MYNNATDVKKKTTAVSKVQKLSNYEENVVKYIQYLQQYIDMLSTGPEETKTPDVVNVVKESKVTKE